MLLRLTLNQTGGAILHRETFFVPGVGELVCLVSTHWKCQTIVIAVAEETLGWFELPQPDEFGAFEQ